MPGITRNIGLSKVRQGTLLNPLERNTDIVESGGYYDIAGDIYVNGFATGSARSFMGLSNVCRIRQTDNIVGLSLYFNKTVASATYFDVWRFDGSLWDRIHHVDILSKLNTGLNNITFDIPLSVQNGDKIGISGSRSASGAQLKRSINHGNGKYIDAYPPADNFDWSTATDHVNNINLIKTLSKAPLIAAIGDSIIAGHPGHYSSVENSLVHSPLNCITGQLALINSAYVCQNMGIGSTTSTQIAARFEADVVALKPRIAIIEGGINDISFGTETTEQFIANMKGMIDASIAADIIPIVCKITPWTSGTNAKMQLRDVRNAELTALVATYPTAIFIDFDSMGQFRVGGDEGNLWDYIPSLTADNTHPNLAGYTVMAQLIDAKIKKRYRFV